MTLIVYGLGRVGLSWCLAARQADLDVIAIEIDPVRTLSKHEQCIFKDEKELTAAYARLNTSRSVPCFRSLTECEFLSSRTGPHIMIVTCGTYVFSGVPPSRTCNGLHSDNVIQCMRDMNAAKKTCAASFVVIVSSLPVGTCTTQLSAMLSPETMLVYAPCSAKYGSIFVDCTSPSKPIQTAVYTSSLENVTQQTQDRVVVLDAVEDDDDNKSSTSSLSHSIRPLMRHFQTMFPEKPIHMYNATTALEFAHLARYARDAMYTGCDAYLRRLAGISECEQAWMHTNHSQRCATRDIDVFDGMIHMSAVRELQRYSQSLHIGCELFDQVILSRQECVRQTCRSILDNYRQSAVVTSAATTSLSYEETPVIVFADMETASDGRCSHVPDVIFSVEVAMLLVRTGYEVCISGCKSFLDNVRRTYGHIFQYNITSANLDVAAGNV